MYKVTIRDHIRRDEELTAAEVRQLPEGAKVRIHSFDRYGAHCTVDTVVTLWTAENGYIKKVLAYSDYYGPGRREIMKENDRMCYTKGEG